MVEFQTMRREELRRWAAGDRTVKPPATGLSPAYLPWSDRHVTMLNRQPRPDSAGRAPYAGKDDDR